MTPLKAEYVKISLVTSQPIWLRRILEDVGEKQEEVTPILYGNKSAVVMSKNPVYYSATNLLLLCLRIQSTIVVQNILPSTSIRR